MKLNDIKGNVVVAEYGNYALIHRDTVFEPWIVAYGYRDGSWQQGHYYSDFMDAVTSVLWREDCLQKKSRQIAVNFCDRHELKAIGNKIMEVSIEGD